WAKRQARSNRRRNSRLLARIGVEKANPTIRAERRDLLSAGQKSRRQNITRMRNCLLGTARIDIPNPNRAIAAATYQQLVIRREPNGVNRSRVTIERRLQLSRRDV